MFEHNFIEVPKLKQINTDDGRRYLIEGTEVKYPSITTVLSKTKDNRWLNAWREKVGKEKAAQITKNATTRGTSLHKMCEYYLLNKPVEIENTSASFMFSGMRESLDRISNVKALETTLYSHSLKVAGTVDCVAVMDNVLSVIDFKTSNKPKKTEYIEDYFLQGCFYFTSYYEITGELPEQVVILIAVQDGTKQEFVLKGKEILQYTDKLQERIKQFYEQLNNTSTD